MRVMRKAIPTILLRISSLLLIAALAYFIANKNWESAKNSEDNEKSQLKLIGAPAPDFSSDRFRLSSFKGKPIILNFWATWCAPCVQEFPDLIRLAQKLRKQDYIVVAVAVEKNWKVIDNFFKQNPSLLEARKQFVLVLDRDGEISNKYGSFRYPETFLINKDFVIDNKFVGAQAWLSSSYQVYYDRLIHKNE